jgi:hypothetical protein
MKGRKMLEFLPQDIKDGLDAAKMRDQRRRSRLRVHVGDGVYPILRMWGNGFSLDASHAAQPRGLVDIYDGAAHIFQCLIVASTAENEELICDFKRSTPVADRPALDFVRAENAPAGYLAQYNAV